MAGGPPIFYRSARKDIIDQTLDISSNVRVILVTSSYTPNVQTHTTYNSVSANEVSGTGYTQYGKPAALSTSNDGNDVDIVDGSSPYTWTSSTITAKYAVWVQDANGDGTIAPADKLVAYADLDTGGGSVSTTSGDFVVTVNAGGLTVVSDAND